MSQSCFLLVPNCHGAGHWSSITKLETPHDSRCSWKAAPCRCRSRSASTRCCCCCAFHTADHHTDIYCFLQIIRPLYSNSKTAAITELQIPESSENKYKTEIIPDIPEKKSKPGILICGKSRDQNLDLQLKALSWSKHNSPWTWDLPQSSRTSSSKPGFAAPNLQL